MVFFLVVVLHRLISDNCAFPLFLPILLGVSLILSSSCKPSHTDTLFLPLFQSKSIVLAVLLPLCPFCPKKTGWVLPICPVVGRYIVFPYMNSVFGCQPFTLWFQSSLNAIWWYWCKHLQHSIPCLTLSGWGVHSGDQSLCIGGRGSSCYCSSSTRSSKITSLLLGLVSSLPFFRVSLSLPVQILNIHHTDSELKVLFDVKLTFNLATHLEKFLLIQCFVMYQCTCTCI